MRLPLPLPLRQEHGLPPLPLPLSLLLLPRAAAATAAARCCRKRAACCGGPAPPHRLAADRLIVLHDAHALQRHEAAVGVGVHHLRGQLVHALARGRRGRAVAARALQGSQAHRRLRRLRAGCGRRLIVAEAGAPAAAALQACMASNTSCTAASPATSVLGRSPARRRPPPPAPWRPPCRRGWPAPAAAAGRWAGMGTFRRCGGLGSGRAAKRARPASPGRRWRAAGLPAAMPHSPA